MLDVFRKLFALLDAREKRNFFVLIGIMVVVSVAEVFGVSTLMLLLNVLTDPGKIQQIAPLSWAYETFGFTSDQSFQIFLTVAVFFIILSSLATKAAGRYAVIRYATMRGHTISRRLLEGYLHQPYTWFLQRNSAEVAKNVLNEVDRVTDSALIPALQMVAGTILTGSIFVFMLVVSPGVAVTATVAIGGGYLAFYLVLKPYLTRTGSEMLSTNATRFQLAQEALGGFKEVKLLGLEHYYVDRFSTPSKRFARLRSFVKVMIALPRFALEALTFGVILAVTLVLQIRAGGDLTAAIPLLGTFAFAVMRMLPALQSLYHGFSALRNGKPLLDHIHADLLSSTSASGPVSKQPVSTERTGLNTQLELRDARFAYPATSRAALNDLNMTVPARTTVGIVGGTGAGKTTLVDAILGLLALDSGSILIDGEPLTHDNMRAWQNSLGYVPQTIYLTDSSIAENIAFGIAQKDIDMAAVEAAAKMAALHDFVMRDLDQGYATIVGERGVRLSGGQRQRIGIARALYNNPEVLILDEATSALDNLTERAVMDAVHNIGDQKTIIMIAHRLSTVRKCDCIFLLEKGRVAAKGTYDEMIQSSEAFREMASTA